ncbi:hypothetical protein AYR62_07685 [Secundilactobacillus paracollinoides]|uniref:Type II secretion system protein GspF domain-containing protein n=1 Tax=Secundilactobacillus paracollinoides TaxID=240427 RepID=A0A1B2J1Q0_9LACO|nr:type II secretion system F family protein [Secundilactobacillus paracollinoides]ANZ62278.1 hypothetical protein AYR61_13700 [Secundilactobacillus paracollinoides]ANZ63967.1 hypothetical protein AYR62_07685 [Secundilactobacillus paracollinoides]ANZ68227.1 hypothetical protein AYR63_14575 [Secundilactobacillus paracollinoides]
MIVSEPVKSQAQQPTASKKVKPWPAKFQADVFQMVSDLLKVGFSVRHAFKFCEVVFKTHLADLRQINQQLQDGQSISGTFEPYIDEQISTQLKLAEKHGQLSQSLSQISRLLTTAHQRKERIKRLLQYPFVLMLILAVVFTGLKIFVFPEIRELTDAPATTGYGLWFGIAGLVLGLLGVGIWLQIKQSPALKRTQQLAGLPIIGGVMRTYYGYYLLSILAIMVQGGLGLQDILVTVKDAKPTTLLYQLGDELDTQLKQGQQLGPILAKYRFVPKELRLLLETGKNREEMGAELAALTEIYYERLKHRLETLMSLIQPLAFLIVGSLIVGTYVSLFLPMYQMIGGFS